MDKKKPQEYIANISKASAYFTLNNGPIKDLISQGKITSEILHLIMDLLKI